MSQQGRTKSTQDTDLFNIYHFMTSLFWYKDACYKKHITGRYCWIFNTDGFLCIFILSYIFLFAEMMDIVTS